MLRWCMVMYGSSLGLLLLVGCRLEDLLGFGQHSTSMLLACLRLQQLQVHLQGQKGDQLAQKENDK